MVRHLIDVASPDRHSLKPEVRRLQQRSAHDAVQ